MKESFRTLIMMKVLFFIVLGILIQKVSKPDILLIAVVSGVLCVLFIYSTYRKNLRNTYLKSLIPLTGLTLMTMLIYKQQAIDFTYDLETDHDSVLGVLIAEEYPNKKNSIRVKTKVVAIDSLVISRNIYAEIYSQNQEMLSIRPNDTLLVRATMQRITPVSGNYGFDYSKYLLDQGISYQMWDKGTSIEIYEAKNRGLDLIKYTWRTDALAKLSKYLSAENFGLASSLLIGYRNELDPETKEQFADTGAMHILAVSGMHVGIVVFLLNILIFGKHPQRQGGKSIAKGLILSFILILYILITGASVPVIRATILYVLLYFAFFLQRDYSSLNVLAAVGALILLWRPSYLFQVSFQLSFAAVASIIIFYPVIYKCIYPPNGLFRFVWSISAMSIAAQVLIFPLTLYYFHQFPVYFIISSIIAISLTFLIIPVGLFFLCLPIATITEPLGVLLDYLCSALRMSIAAISSWPFATVENLSISLPSVGFFYAILISVALFLYTFRGQWIITALYTTIALLIYNIGHEIYHKNQFLIHDYKSGDLTDVIIGPTAYQWNPNGLNPNELNLINGDLRRIKHVTEIKEAFPNELCKYIK